MLCPHLFIALGSLRYVLNTSRPYQSLWAGLISMRRRLRLRRRRDIRMVSSYIEVDCVRVQDMLRIWTWHWQIRESDKNCWQPFKPNSVFLHEKTFPPPLPTFLQPITTCFLCIENMLGLWWFSMLKCVPLNKNDICINLLASSTRYSNCGVQNRESYIFLGWEPWSIGRRLLIKRSWVRILTY